MLSTSGLRPMKSRSDTTGNEFISTILRYVSGYKIVERLVGLVRVSDMGGKGLSNILKARLEAIGVKLTSIVGQCYDGASNMSGEYRGVQAKIKREAGDKAVYTHCYNHLLRWCWNAVHLTFHL